MSSGFLPDLFTAGRRSAVVPTNMKLQQQGSLSSPVAGNPADPTARILARRGADTIPMGKRSLTEFQQQQNFLQQQQGLEFYLRNVKPRHGNYQHAPTISNPSTVALPQVSNSLMNNVNSRYGLTIIKQQRPQSLILSNTGDVSTGVFLPNLISNKASVDSIQGPDFSARESEKMILDLKLQELEKRLLGDEDDAEEVSTVTTTELSETMLNLINPARKPLSPSPTSSSSSCSSTAASPLLTCPKRCLLEAAVAISERKPDIASELFSRLQHLSNERGTSEQRLAAYMVSAMKSRASPLELPPPPVSELYGKEHYVATQLLYDVLPCFRHGFMAANQAILTSASERGFSKIHVVDFDIGHGLQYVHLIHALAANISHGKPSSMLKITTFTDSSAAEKLKDVGDRLKNLANEKGVCFSIRIKNSGTKDLSRESLEVQSDEALAVNFAFTLCRIPDESVSTDNQRDDLLRRVKMMSPAVMTIVEQEMNTNTAPLVARVREACDHYGALLESLDATVSREDPRWLRIEQGLCLRMKNSVACEGRDRVERCEVFGKWRARLGMSGFKIRPASQPVVDSLRSKLHYETGGNPGFTVNEESGGVSFGWMGRTITVASAWY
ncbi:scarecrow-like protein 8-like [Dorcoceras hygrometricum]|uniref:Scarecrow-like protein 8-like n=1 Tax=Dorcoceras hygrometricum TaxID=472368 RepID=A0A2Z7BW97_9LAMI|nr:scarecrow-like protein 8-like [Dorcoceras hygrometricum]